MKFTQKINDPFLYGAPVLDLHGENFQVSALLTKVFIEDAIKLKNKKIVIIHGKGKGIIKQAVYDELKINRNVKDYKTDLFNNGMTIINLK